MVRSRLLICSANGQRGVRLCLQCQRTNWVKGERCSKSSSAFACHFSVRSVIYYRQNKKNNMLILLMRKHFLEKKYRLGKIAKMTILVKHTGIATEYGERASYPSVLWLSVQPWGDSSSLQFYWVCYIAVCARKAFFFLKNSKKLFLLEILC